MPGERRKRGKVYYTLEELKRKKGLSTTVLPLRHSPLSGLKITWLPRAFPHYHSDMCTQKKKIWGKAVSLWARVQCLTCCCCLAYTLAVEFPPTPAANCPSPCIFEEWEAFLISIGTRWCLGGWSASICDGRLVSEFVSQGREPEQQRPASTNNTQSSRLLNPQTFQLAISRKRNN